MRKFEVEWAVHARGTIMVDAKTAADAQFLVDDMGWDDLLAAADRVDWTSTPTEVTKMSACSSPAPERGTTMRRS